MISKIVKKLGEVARKYCLCVTNYQNGFHF